MAWSASESKSAAVRARLSYPIIDSDGHTAEFEPALFDYLRAEAGARTVERLKSLSNSPISFRWYRMTPQERRDYRLARPLWAAHPTRNTLDRATSSLPRLLHQRLPEMGIDFTVIYPSFGIVLPNLGEAELRRASCRALNKLHADIFRDYADRMTPAAVIPMHTPAEAVEELDYAVTVLGFKVVLMPAFVMRPVAAVARRIPEAARHVHWFDTFAMDSEYDYDPVWAKCLQLKVAPTFHTGTMGLGTRNSISNFIYNHIGHFAASAEAICKALFLGGVTRRFPDLRFTFLEGGAGWATNLLCDLTGHWEKHNVETVANYDPAALDNDLMRRLMREYGGDYGELAGREEDRSQLLWGAPQDPADLDEWARCAIRRREDIRDLFVPKFFFGCEGDDRMTAVAFEPNKNPFGARLGAIYGSDMGHFDLPNMRDAAAEAWEMVEQGCISQEDFRDFVFVNPVRAKAEVNPDFFKGTVVEDAARKLLVDIGSGG
jgi:predicted TIM-barrel fold metal-dependent hydrolase